MEKYIASLKMDWHKLKILPVLTVEQIKEYNNDCIRMYLYCYYNYPEFYKYKKKKLLNRYVNATKSNLLLFSTWCGNLNILKYLISCGFDINYVNNFGQNAYMCAIFNFKIEIIKYIETTNINIYQRDCYLNNAYDFACEYCPATYKYFMDKILYTGYSKICSICYSNKNDTFITCKNNHIVHLKCQRLKNKYRCLNCSFKYLI